MASESREESVYVAKLAEQAERYDEMVEAMEKVAKTVDVEELTVEERNLLSVAYKNVIGARRASWRIISSIEQKEESKGNEEHVAAIRDYRAKVEQELSTICDSILNLLNTHLIPTSSTGESKVFYLKMKGDYHRYLAEFKTGAERKEAAESTLLAYKSAQVSITSSRCTLEEPRSVGTELLVFPSVFPLPCPATPACVPDVASTFFFWFFCCRTADKGPSSSSAWLAVVVF
jgi:hypothetical protein